MSSAPLSSEQGLVASSVVVAPAYSFKFNNSSKETIPPPPTLPTSSQVSRVITKESLQAVADVAETISSSPTAAASITNCSSSSSLFEFSLSIDNNNEESELLSLPLTTIELPLTPPPLETDGYGGCDSFESCAATLLTPATVSSSSGSESASSSAVSTAAAIAASSYPEQQPTVAVPAPPISIRAPPIVSVAQLQPPLITPVVTPKPPVAFVASPKAKKASPTRARSNSKTASNQKAVQPLQQRVSPVVHTAPAAPRLTSSMDQQPPLPASQPAPQRAPSVPTPMTVAAPATTAVASAPPRTVAAAPTAMAGHPQATTVAQAQGGQPLPSTTTTAVAGRKYAPAPVATTQVVGVPAPVQYAPLPQQAPPTTTARPRASSNARSTPTNTSSNPNSNNSNQTTSNTVSTLHPTTGQVENTGRWTAEEHRLFLQGLEQHGKGWKKIATLIKSRTVVQIRTHAQKYFQKLAKARQNGEAVGVVAAGALNNGGNVATLQGVPIGTAEGDGTIGIAIPVGADGQPVVTMRTTTHATSAHSGNMSLGNDATSLAAAQGSVGIATGGGLPQSRRGKRRNGAPGGGTKRRAIGSVVRSAVREGRNVKRQKVAENKRNGGNKVAPAPAVSSGVMPAPVAQVPSAQVAAPQGAPAPVNSNEEYQVPNPLPSVSNILDPYVTTTMGGMPPPPSVLPAQKKGSAQQQRGRQQMVQTATHGTLPMAALEDAVFRLLTPATGAPGPMPGTQPPPPPQPTSSAIVDPLAPQPMASANQGNKIPVNHTQYHAPNTGAPLPPPPSGYPQGILPNSSPTGVADMSLLPSWVDAKNPPQWYNDGSDIDTLLEDADCLNWLSDTGDLEETYPPAVAEPAAVVSSSSTVALTASSMNVEPTPVLPALSVQDPTGGVVHPSTESLSFLVDPPEQHHHHHGVMVAPAPVAVAPPAVEDVHQLPAFLEEAAEAAPVAPQVEPALTYASATEAVQACEEPTIPEHKLAGVGESDTNLMGFPDLDMGDEQAFVSALLENSGQSTMSFPKLNSDLHITASNSQSGVALSSVPEEQGANETA